MGQQMDFFPLSPLLLLLPSNLQLFQRPLTKTWFQRPLTIETEDAVRRAARGSFTEYAILLLKKWFVFFVIFAVAFLTESWHSEHCVKKYKKNT